MFTSCSGFIDDSVTSDTITYTPVDKYVHPCSAPGVSFLHLSSSQGFWQVPSTSWTLNGKTKERSGNTTILDTGTTLLLVSDDVVDELYGAIEGAEFDNEQGGYKFPSSATLPDVSFAVGDKLYKVRNTVACGVCSVPYG